MKKNTIKVALNAIQEAGGYLKKQFHNRHELSMKPDKTELLGEDLKSESIIINSLSLAFPTDSFFTEETKTKITSERVWVIDPLCGSYSYLRGVETWSLSIALVVNNVYVIGAVYQPLLGNLFYSEYKKGAYFNGKKIYPSKTSNLSRAFISIEHGVFKSGKINLAKLISDVKRIRVGHGSGGELAYVAAGFLDGLIKTDQTLTHFAGGRAILEVAGGVFLDFSGNRAPTYFDKEKTIDYIAANTHLEQKLLSYTIT